ncbi:MAG TPA: (5-formylfuran-3-yl)methyl phosphate synthase [Candidatus Polarisedimenticolia bacterium]|nr:(5-formylfuran-3-yl)methyl phosphate synthase [Candidatus Polarisedimenticolia bacterium]
MPGLLASVRDPEEARLALAVGADVLDVKEPGEGALGACPPATLRAIVTLRDAGRGRVPVSAALGDAPDLPGTLALAAAGAAACGVDLLKVGLHGVAREAEAIRLVRAVVTAARAVAPGVRVVAAAYADAAAIGALPPALLPAVAGRAGAHGCLIDTFRKDGRGLLAHLTAADLERFVADCRRRGLSSALAGSLTLADVPRLLALCPDLIGARGALCDGGRSGRLDAARLRAFRLALGVGRRPAPRHAPGVATSRRAGARPQR